MLHKALDQAVQLDYLTKNVSDLCILPKSQKREIHPLKDDDVPAFLNTIAGHEYESLYRIALFTGMRQGELLGLTWDSVDFNRGTIRIHQQLQRMRKEDDHEYKLVPTKNGKERTIVLAKQVIQILRQVRSRQMEWKLRCGEIWNNDMNLVFTNSIGQHLNDRTVYRQIKMAVARIGRPEVRFHDLRHTYATLALQNGDDIKTLSANLGHATTSFTMDVYGHVSQTMQEMSASRMEKFISSL